MEVFETVNCLTGMQEKASVWMCEVARAMNRMRHKAGYDNIVELTVDRIV